MTQIIDGPTRTFTASAALSQYRRVRLDSNGEIAYCSASDTDCVGYTTRPTFARGDEVAVRLTSAAGTQIVVASAAISQGAACYAAASGKVAATGTVLVGEPLEAAGADGDWIEIEQSPSSILGTTARTSLTQDDLAPYALPLEWARVWDAPHTSIPGTPASDDLGLIDNTFLTASPTIESGDLKNAGATTRKARFAIHVPEEYVAGETLTLRANAGMKTTVASVSATIDFQVARRAAPTVDICATNATSINSLTAANKDFTLTPTSVVPGDILDIVCSAAVNDSGTGTAVIAQLNSLAMLADIKG